MKSTKLNPTLTAGAVVLAAINLVYSQEKPYTQPQPGAAVTEAPVEKPFSESFIDAFKNGKVNLNSRLRYEYVHLDPSPADEAHALTIRTRLGFTTAPLYGFQGMLEAENVTAIPDDEHYRISPGAPGNADREVVADPETTEINQAWVSYSNWKTTLKGGRQRIVLDNHRFIGDVGWRQNQQTFDAVALSSAPVTNLNLFYGYVWEVNRVFGDVSGLNPNRAFDDFGSHSHLINVSYNACEYAKVTGYAYLLDLDNNAAAGDTFSSATYGMSLTGSHTFDKNKGAKLNYRAEYAYQTDYADQPMDYSAHYLNAEASGSYDRFTLGGGYELLGSDDGMKGFITPLATLHAFNGWADVFLVTPNNGLQDMYAFAGVKLPGNVPLRVVYHKYCSDDGSDDLGQEIDVVASRAFGKHFTGLLKYAYYDGVDAPAAFDRQILWAQMEFNF